MKRNKISYKYDGVLCTSLFGYTYDEVAKYGEKELLRLEVQLPSVMSKISEIRWSSVEFECEY